MSQSKSETEKRLMAEPEMPLELQMDLLVDEELPEDRRRALLLSLDRGAGAPGWRELALRFLQRQVERRSVRDLIAGGRLVPVEEEAPVYRFSRGSWGRSWRTARVAAGLMIAVGLALVTGYWMHRGADNGQNGLMVANGPRNVEMMKANLPGQAMGVREAVPVEFQVVSDQNPPMFSSHDGETSPRRTLVIQPDGPGKAMVIPVNTLAMKVY